MHGALVPLADDERFTAAEFGKCLVVSACSGHGYKFGASVGRRTAEAVESGGIRAQPLLPRQLPRTLATIRSRAPSAMWSGRWWI